MTNPAIDIKTDRRFIRANGKSSRFIVASITAPSAPTRATRALPPFSLLRGLSRSARPYLDRGRDAWQTASGLLARTPPIAALNPNTKISLQKATKETKQEALNRRRQKKFPCGMSMRLLLRSLRLLL